MKSRNNYSLKNSLYPEAQLRQHEDGSWIFEDIEGAMFRTNPDGAGLWVNRGESKGIAGWHQCLGASAFVVDESNIVEKVKEFLALGIMGGDISSGIWFSPLPIPGNVEAQPAAADFFMPGSGDALPVPV